MSGVSLCRDAGDSDRPCPFVAACHESRQRLQHYEGLRGTACWAYQMLSRKRQDLLPQVEIDVERAALQEGL